MTGMLWKADRQLLLPRTGKADILTLHRIRVVPVKRGRAGARPWRLDDPLIDRFKLKRMSLQRSGLIPNPLLRLIAHVSNQRVLNIEKLNHNTRHVA